jgi:DNA-binding transcriptional MerR regulator
MTELSIGALARKTSCNVQTIRYYEQIGLLPSAGRTVGNQRFYQDSHADRLGFIRHARELGFPLDAVRTLLQLNDDPGSSCAEADRIARDQLRDVESKIARLTTLQAELRRMIRQCRPGKVATCRVIEALADHSRCQAEHGEVAPAARRKDARRKN